ncbi:MAG: hypothetical protein EOO01_17945 [Chitinophagaceae bacterium]|nr:MAG: hypothetical protein EOO01_17945 [Chitinophagaceae bacterium]
MIKIFLNIFLLICVFKCSYSQVPDTVRAAIDTSRALPADRIPVLSDTTEYNDTIIKKTASGKDTAIVKKKVHSPRRATLRSLIIPGWGQIYNKKYWKVPIVYAAIGVPIYTFTYNRKWYNKTKYALSIVANNRSDPDSLERVDPALKFLVETGEQGSLVDYRNDFRKDMDYSILFTLLMWGLNIVDATVDAHLKGFDVGDELSIYVKPTVLPNTMTPAISVVVKLK